MPMMFIPPQVNYVMTYPMHSTPHKREYIPSPDLDLVFSMVISSIGILDPDIPTLIDVVDMYSFWSVFLPSIEHILEAMDGVCTLTCIPSRAFSSSKP
jgi:hypothetical protein